MQCLEGSGWWPIVNCYLSIAGMLDPSHPDLRSNSESRSTFVAIYTYTTKFGYSTTIHAPDPLSIIIATCSIVGFCFSKAPPSCSQRNKKVGILASYMISCGGHVLRLSSVLSDTVIRRVISAYSIYLGREQRNSDCSNVDNLKDIFVNYHDLDLCVGSDC